ncbi:PPOX class F420-dependent oxidoreductase [Streptomyces yaizuensis]|uniref:TIGR03618 family F420-dependent PPOX class oxidoreductase n=1 Tax=Streptomyces yaizuensis TaxID=2989713 RepID=A0ABQ5P6I7_9ACTN|nr:PPOX class F420-dependent oxidoreductase [Streptomyces sp. YSPA8]GLF97836.1 TIGR03618 family F420-dependent PPOX class oxidoreductase [Streptomyces sp. YSPA8]
MSQGPAPRALSDAALSELLSAGRFGTLATNKSNGRPHLTTMLYHWDPEERIVRFSTTADRVKVRQLRKDPRAAVHVPGGDVWSFAVAEGEAEVSPVTSVPGDAVGRELLAMLPGDMRPEGGAAETVFLEQQVAQGRVVLRLRVDRLYGTALDVG